MKILKGCALSFLSFILFLSLCIFGIAYSVNQVALNPHYIVKILNDINFSQIIQETIDEQASNGDISPELQTALIDTLRKMEPVIKERIGIALEDTYAYLKGKTTAPNFKETLSKSVMNSDFVAELLNDIDISQLIDQIAKGQIGTGAGSSDAFTNALITAIDKSEPELKKQLVNASGPIFDYLLMKSSSIDLKSTLRQTILNDTTVGEILSNLDYTMMTKDILSPYIGGQLPKGIQLSSEQINRVMTAEQPYLIIALAYASGNFADFLTGTKANFDVKVDLTPSFPTLKTVVKEAFIAQMPPQTSIDSAFEQYYADFIKTIPTTYEVNSNDIDLGTGTASGISNTLTNAQNSLTEARNNIDNASRNFEIFLKEAKTYVGYFRTGFACLIALIILLILGMILIYRSVKGSCRNLGIVFFIYGAGAFAIVLIIKYFALQKIAGANIPQSLSNIPGILLNDILSPLQLVGLVCLIGGFVLIVVSLIYPRLKPAKID